MRTDVFPEEDSVRVVWSRACLECEGDCEMEWQIKSRSKRADQTRFSGSVHGFLEDGSPCGDCVGTDGRTNLPLISYAANTAFQEPYRAGLFGRRYPYPAPTNEFERSKRAAYDLGRDEAQLIDWQK